MPDPYSDEPNQAHELQHAELITATGRHPAIVVRPEPRSRLVLGLVLDVVAVICITVLIALDKVSAAEGLPWVALLLGLKAKQAAAKKNGAPPTATGGAILGLLGL